MAASANQTFRDKLNKAQHACAVGFYQAILSTSLGRALRDWKIRKYGQGKLFEPAFEERLKTLRRLEPRPLVEDEINKEVKSYRDQTWIVVSLTTIPTRIANMTRTLSTFDLSEVDEVLVSIPEVSGRTGKSYDIPKELLQISPKVRILEVPKDLGPITKMLPAAELYRDTKALIISIDDDSHYSKGMIPEMIRLAALNPGHVFSGSGPSLSFWGIQAPNFMQRKNGPTARIPYPDYAVDQAEVVEGFAGVAYPNEIFKARLSTESDITVLDALRAISQKTKETFGSDDLVISAVLHRAGVPMFKFGSNFYKREFPFLLQAEYGFGKDALHLGAGLYDENIKDLTSDQVNARKYSAALKTATDYFLANQL